MPFTVLPNLPSTFMSPSYNPRQSFWSPEFQPVSSTVRKLLLGGDLPSVADAGSSAHSVSEVRASAMRRTSAFSQNIGNNSFVKRRKISFPPDLAMEASKQGDMVDAGPFKCYGLPYGPQKTGPNYILASHSPQAGRMSNPLPPNVMSDPFVLDKLLHTFQTMRCSVDNISQELRVLNTHLASLSRHFSTLSQNGPFPQYGGQYT